MDVKGTALKETAEIAAEGPHNYLRAVPPRAGDSPVEANPPDAELEAEQEEVIEIKANITWVLTRAK